MILCVEGISGSGKSTLINRLQEFFWDRKYEVHSYHFYSEIGAYAPRFGTLSKRIESELFNEQIQIERKIECLKELCELGIKAFNDCEWEKENVVYLFDRSPLTYLAYIHGGLNKSVILSGEFHSTIRRMKPFILNTDVGIALNRREKRKEKRMHEILHNSEFEFNSHVQNCYLSMNNDPYCLDSFSATEIYENVVSAF